MHGKRAESTYSMYLDVTLVLLKSGLLLGDDRQDLFNTLLIFSHELIILGWETAQ